MPLRTLSLAHDLDLADVAAPEWPICAPRDLTKSHGVNLTLAHLEQAAADYNPALEAAPINLDHVRSGDALGWIQSLSVRDGVLYARPTELAPELIEKIKSGRVRRPSAELTLAHESTGRCYLVGLALLGAQRPAVRGLEVHLSQHPEPRLTFQLSPDGAYLPQPHDAAPAAVDLNAAPADQETPMPDTAANPIPTPAPATPPAPTVDLAAREQELDQILLRARRREATATVDAQLTALGSRVTPAMLRTGVRDLLIELSAASNPAIIQLAAAAGQPAREARQADVILALLAAVPESSLLGAPLATAAASGTLAVDPRSPERRALDLSLGITDEAALRTLARHADALDLAN